MDDVFIQNALAYAGRHHLELAERLGFGIHGIIFAAGNKSAGGQTAVKAHREEEPYRREREIYGRLKQAHVAQVLGFNVPQFIRADDGLRVIEMSIVTRPFVLDFAGAYLDAPPNFSEEIWADWEAGKRDQFEVRWPKVRAVLVALEDWGVYIVVFSDGQEARNAASRLVASLATSGWNVLGANPGMTYFDGVTIETSIRQHGPDDKSEAAAAFLLQVIADEKEAACMMPGTDEIPSNTIIIRVGPKPNAEETKKEIESARGFLRVFKIP